MKIISYVIGGIIGAGAGFLYYYFVGCTTGQCPITSNPWSATVYGVVLGVLVANILVK